MPATAKKELTPEERTEAIVRKVRALINQSSSPAQEEAASAAMQACKLIRKYGLDVLNPLVINKLYADAKAEKDQILAEARKQAAEIAPHGDSDYDGIVSALGIPRRPPVVSPPSQNWSTSTMASPGYSASAMYQTYQAPPITPQAPRNTGGSYTPPTAPTVTPPEPVVTLSKGAKFAAKCLQCGKAIVVGQQALWQKGTGMWCLDTPSTSCRQTWVAGRGNKGTTSGYKPPF